MDGGMRVCTLATRSPRKERLRVSRLRGVWIFTSSSRSLYLDCIAARNRPIVFCSPWTSTCSNIANESVMSVGWPETSAWRQRIRVDDRMESDLRRAEP
jgi:hypothetical protein